MSGLPPPPPPSAPAAAFASGPAATPPSRAAWFVATTIAGDLGLQTDVLDPIEAITPESRGDNYIAVMQSNLVALEKANGCR